MDRRGRQITGILVLCVAASVVVLPAIRHIYKTRTPANPDSQEDTPVADARSDAVRPDAAPAPAQTQDKGDDERTTLPSELVDPTAGLDALIRWIDEDIPLSEQKRDELAQFIQTTRQHYEAEDRPDWVKTSEYYESLDTLTLSKECFSVHAARIMFNLTFTVYDDPTRAFHVAAAKHRGLAELFEREDMWKGMLVANEYLSSTLDATGEPSTNSVCGAVLCRLRWLYGISPLKEQIGGREKMFLTSTLRVLKRFKKFMEDTDASDIFHGEPIWTAQAALVFARRVDPSRYARIEPAIRSVRYPRKQRIQDVLHFVNLVITGLDEFVSPADERALVDLTTHIPAASDRSPKRH